MEKGYKGRKHKGDGENLQSTRQMETYFRT